MRRLDHIGADQVKHNGSSVIETLSSKMFRESCHTLAHRLDVEIDPGDDAWALLRGGADKPGCANRRRLKEQPRCDERQYTKPDRSYQWIDLLGLAG